MEKSKISPIPILIEDLGIQTANENSTQLRRYGIYECSCGKKFRSRSSHVNSGKTTGCGCRAKALKHGLSKGIIYKTLSGMKSRVSNKNNKSYKDYGGRGISICKEWMDSPELFVRWSLDNGYDKGLSIDRINNDGNYEPSNCRWVTKEIQMRNTRVLQSNNTSGFRGVSSRIDGMFIANIGIDSELIYLGYFSTALEAAIAYDKYVIENSLEHTTNGLLYEWYSGSNTAVRSKLSDEHYNDTNK